VIAAKIFVVIPGLGTWLMLVVDLAAATRRYATRPGRMRPGLHFLSRFHRLVDCDRDGDRVADAG
jgi:hypothetical protein